MLPDCMPKPQNQSLASVNNPENDSLRVSSMIRLALLRSSL